MIMPGEGEEPLTWEFTYHGHVDCYCIAFLYACGLQPVGLQCNVFINIVHASNQLLPCIAMCTPEAIPGLKLLSIFGPIPTSPGRGLTNLETSSRASENVMTLSSPMSLPCSRAGGPSSEECWTDHAKISTLGISGYRDHLLPQ